MISQFKTKQDIFSMSDVPALNVNKRSIHSLGRLLQTGRIWKTIGVQLYQLHFHDKYIQHENEL